MTQKTDYTLIDMILALDISRDNRRIVTGSRDKSIRVFDIKSKQQVAIFEKAHSGEPALFRFN